MLSIPDVHNPITTCIKDQGVTETSLVADRLLAGGSPVYMVSTAYTWCIAFAGAVGDQLYHQDYSSHSKQLSDADIHSRPIADSLTHLLQPRC